MAMNQKARLLHVSFCRDGNDLEAQPRSARPSISVNMSLKASFRDKWVRVQPITACPKLSRH